MSKQPLATTDGSWSSYHDFLTVLSRFISTLHIKEDGNSIKKISPVDQGIGKTVGYFLDNDRCGQIQSNMAGTILWMLVLGAIQKQTEQVRWSK